MRFKKIVRQSLPAWMDHYERWWVAILLAGVICLQLLPLVRYPIIPTQDGPAHLEMAYVMTRLWREPDGAHAQIYAFNRLPVPNVLGHYALAVLMPVTGPVMAEKFLIGVYVGLFWLACVMLLRRAGIHRRALVFLYAPFVLSYPFHMGFYNFSLSVPLFLIVIACWLRWQDSLSRWRRLWLNLLLLLLYTAHFLSFTLALVMVGVLTLVAVRGSLSRGFARMTALLPAGLLFPAWLWLGPPSSSSNYWGVPRLARYLARSGSLTSYLAVQDRYGTWFFRLLLVLVVITVVVRIHEYRRERSPLRRSDDVFAIMALVALLAYFVAPARLSGGSYVSERLMLYPMLLLIPWFRVRWPVLRLSVAVAALVFFGLYHYSTIRSYDMAVPRLMELRRGAEVMGADAVYLPLVGGRERPVRNTVRILPFMHAAAYHAMDARVVNLKHYGARTGYFPVVYRPGRNPYDGLGDLRHDWQRNLPYYEYPGCIDYLSYRGPLPEEPLLSRLLREYEPVASNRYVTIFQKR